MSGRLDLSHYSFATPATFRLQLLGHLDASWSTELENADIEYGSSANEQPISILIAHIVDQAALMGLLNRLYGLGFPLISVECMQLD